MSKGTSYNKYSLLKMMALVATFDDSNQDINHQSE